MSAEHTSLRTQLTVSVVANVAALVCCLGVFSIGGVICAATALGRVRTDAPGARTLLYWSWGFLVANLVGWILVIGGVLLFHSLSS